jgi:hypothetical protein
MGDVGRLTAKVAVVLAFPVAAALLIQADATSRDAHRLRVEHAAELARKCLDKSGSRWTRAEFVKVQMKVFLSNDQHCPPAARPGKAAPVSRQS